jgi:two-component system sensor histidine kinase DesK
MNFSMRELMWGLQSHEERLGAFVSKALLQAETFLNKAQIHFDDTVHIENDAAVIPGPVRRELLFSLKEAINNIYKHSQAANVFISVMQIGSTLVVEVKDNGIGLSSARQTGNGLHNMQQRMKNIGGVFEILPVSHGTHLRYTVPI